MMWGGQLLVLLLLSTAKAAIKPQLSRKSAPEEAERFLLLAAEISVTRKLRDEASAIEQISKPSELIGALTKIEELFVDLVNVQSKLVDAGVTLAEVSGSAADKQLDEEDHEDPGSPKDALEIGGAEVDLLKQIHAEARAAECAATALLSAQAKDSKAWQALADVVQRKRSLDAAKAAAAQNQGDEYEESSIDASHQEACNSSARARRKARLAMAKANGAWAEVEELRRTLETIQKDAGRRYEASAQAERALNATTALQEQAKRTARDEEDKYSDTLEKLTRLTKWIKARVDEESANDTYTEEIVVVEHIENGSSATATQSVPAQQQPPLQQQSQPSLLLRQLARRLAVRAPNSTVASSTAPPAAGTKAVNHSEAGKHGAVASSPAPAQEGGEKPPPSVVPTAKPEMRPAMSLPIPMPMFVPGSPVSDDDEPEAGTDAAGQQPKQRPERASPCEDGSPCKGVESPPEPEAIPGRVDEAPPGTPVPQAAATSTAAPPVAAPAAVATTPAAVPPPPTSTTPGVGKLPPATQSAPKPVLPPLDAPLPGDLPQDVIPGTPSPDIDAAAEEALPPAPAAATPAAAAPASAAPTPANASVPVPQPVLPPLDGEDVTTTEKPDEGAMAGPGPSPCPCDNADDSDTGVVPAAAAAAAPTTAAAAASTTDAAAASTTAAAAASTTAAAADSSAAAAAAAAWTAAARAADAKAAAAAAAGVAAAAAADSTAAAAAASTAAAAAAEPTAAARSAPSAASTTRSPTASATAAPLAAKARAQAADREIGPAATPAASTAPPSAVSTTPATVASTSAAPAASTAAASATAAGILPTAASAANETTAPLATSTTAPTTTTSAANAATAPLGAKESGAVAATPTPPLTTPATPPIAPAVMAPAGSNRSAPSAATKDAPATPPANLSANASTSASTNASTSANTNASTSANTNASTSANTNASTSANTNASTSANTAAPTSANTTAPIASSPAVSPAPAIAQAKGLPEPWAVAWHNSTQDGIAANDTLRAAIRYQAELANLLANYSLHVEKAKNWSRGLARARVVAAKAAQSLKATKDSHLQALTVVQTRLHAAQEHLQKINASATLARAASKRLKHECDQTGIVRQNVSVADNQSQEVETALKAAREEVKAEDFATDTKRRELKASLLKLKNLTQSFKGPGVHEQQSSLEAEVNLNGPHGVVPLDKEVRSQAARRKLLPAWLTLAFTLTASAKFA